MTDTHRKKLIEVALPLEAINEESARRKRKAPAGYPTLIHKWWAQRPLAACRAVLFASLVDDPSSDPALTEAEQDAKRQELFRIIEDLVRWENSNNEEVLARARAEIRRCCGENPPPVLDPFCGGGSIPLEAQRLGLEARGSDLNPVAVLITKALIEIPPRFAGHKPVYPEARRQMRTWRGAEGLAADVRAYGAWMRAEAGRRIGRLYPKVRLPKAQGGGAATVIAWLWARTVTCPNPACGAAMPLVRSFALSTKKGREAWVEPVVEPGAKQVRFEIRSGAPADPIRVANGTGMVTERGKKVQATFLCAACQSGVAKPDYIDREANAGRMGVVPLALVAEGNRRRVYLPVPEDHIEGVKEGLKPFLADPEWQASLPNQACRGTFASNAQGRRYGFHTFKDYFTDRQLVALTTFSDLVGEARRRALADARAAGLPDDAVPLAEGGCGAHAYADAVATYLAFGVSRLADYGSSLASWRPKDAAMRSALAKQALPMVWDFAEGNPFGDSSSGFEQCLDVVTGVVDRLPATAEGYVEQADATTKHSTGGIMVCTDPPYYDNISYADLSDFFFIWLRRSLNPVYPQLFSTLLTPKSSELIASPYRFDGQAFAARQFFESGLRRAFETIRTHRIDQYPTTLFYAFKQAETSASDDLDGNHAGETTASTGWETMLEALVGAGFRVTGTWPLRTEGDNRQIGIGANALASSILLVCWPRPADAPIATRAEFVRSLRRELPDALRTLQHGNIAPVDLAQAAIGPGMAVYSRYSEVREPDGRRLPIRTALTLINQVLDEILAEQEGEYDADTRLAVAWFETHGLDEGPFGDAEGLAKAKNASVAGLQQAGILRARGGKVALLGRSELPADWDPASDRRRTVWEAAQHLVRALDTGGEEAAAALMARLGADAAPARDLAYRLYTVCERKGWAEEARAYNGLVVAWPSIAALAERQERPAAPAQTALL